MKSTSPLFLVMAMVVAMGGSAHAQPPSIKDFVARPAYSTARISPNGDYLAITVENGDQDVLTILRTSDLKILKVNQLPEKKSVGQFVWISPDRIMFNAVKKMGGYAQPFSLGEWYAVNADGSQAVPVIFRGTRDATQRGKTVGSESFSLLDTLKGDDRNVIMQARYPRSTEGAGTEVVRVDTLTGRRTSLGRAPKSNCSISLDAAKEPRFAVCSSSRDESGEYDERTELYRRDGQNWTLVNASKSDGKHLSVSRTTDNGTVYAMQDDGKAPAAVGTLDTASGAFNPLFSDPVAEISQFIWSTDQNSLIGVVTEAGAPKVTLLDEGHADAELYASLAAAFDGEKVDFSSYTEDGSKILVAVSSDSNPGELYIFDRKAGKARFLMSRMAQIDKKKMANVKPFSFRARDGRLIHAFITLPNGLDGKNLPLIVNPHGGPIGPRDDWGFNPEAQLFASRGYATLQVNYRGSGGYGKAFQDAGHLQWAQGIQNDILDATHWAIDHGYADQERICIYGGSFGGYSSLMAPIREPGLFKCTFGYVGVYDVDMMFKKGDIPESSNGQRYLRRTHGSDSQAWLDSSPARRAAEVRIPVYLAAGARDVRTPPEQTELMNKALIAAGNKPEGMIIQPGEMHGFYGEEARINLYTEMLDFFNRHIGTGTVSVGAPSRSN
ncbi:S9 family peptidase [Stenotrophomonas sp. YIM B06876]|uniref:alpha/beta hydrolase family protein n=1 Tax=Stenotrophomonas sp. YIM B06876 TaxID=3060211 RepID=UPI002739E8B4|nr:S9 family peptidase [Stenotrophomonas sp. YIM B06876]